ncbi:MAG: polyphosphate kinase 2 [Planctomycetales bacterium]|nr:polyphosphate kinase 2 [Planctomycetales bacterium]
MEQPISKKEYKSQLKALQIELVKLQRDVIESNRKILVLFEGRDAGGKDGTIKRIVQHLSPRETRVVALGKPSDRDRTAWYLQRYISQLPYAQEIVLFNRSWYNRAGVERVMGFCHENEYQEFLDTVPEYEQMLVRSGTHLIKYYLDISQDEQALRLEERHRDPLKMWKISPIDQVAQEHWQAYSEARNAMFLRTHHPAGPWNIVRANDKRLTRLNVIRDLLSRFDYPGKDVALTTPDPTIVFPFEPHHFENGMIAP